MTDIMSGQQPRDMQEELRQAKETVAGPVPLIGDAPDVSLTLPRGLFHRNVWQKEVVVRELTGADEEALSKVPDQLAFYGTVIALGTESIGELDLASTPLAERKFHLGDLLLGERDMIFMKVAQVSFGDKKEIAFTCARCQAEQELTALISEDFKPREVENIDVLIHNYTTSKGDVLEYRAATGVDQDEAIGKKGATAAEQNTIILSRCITKRNGDLIVDPLDYARNMGIRDRQDLLDKLVALQPLVDLTLKTVCAACGGDQTLSLGWGDIFRP